jgi:hypothetical protein
MVPPVTRVTALDFAVTRKNSLSAGVIIDAIKLDASAGVVKCMVELQ